MLGYCNVEIIISTKLLFSYRWKLYKLFCIENNFTNYYAICHNLFCLAHYSNPSKWYISILQDKSSFLKLGLHYGFLYHRTNQVSLSLVSIMGYPGITGDNFYEMFFGPPSYRGFHKITVACMSVCPSVSSAFFWCLTWL